MPQGNGLDFAIMLHDPLTPPTPTQQPPTNTTAKARTTPPTTKAHTTTAATAQRRRTWFDVVPPVLSCVSLLVLAWCMLIRNIPELGMGAQPSILDIPTKAISSHGLGDTIDLLVFLIPCIVGLPRSPLVRTAIIIIADIVYVFVPINLFGNNVIVAVLAVLAVGWFFVSFTFFDEDYDPIAIYRASAKRIFAVALISGLAICVAAPLPTAITRMGRPSSDFTGLQSPASGAGDAVRLLLTTPEWWRSCAFVMGCALCAACMFAAHTRTGFWGRRAGLFIGLWFSPVAIAAMAWTFEAYKLSCVSTVGFIALMTLIAITADEHDYRHQQHNH